MERLPTVPLLEAVPRALGVVFGETRRLLTAGPAAFDRESIRATKITRQTIGGKEGGVYYVLAPGPSLLLAPTLRLDRAINRARGDEGRVAVSVLVFVLLGARPGEPFSSFSRATRRAGRASLRPLPSASHFTPPFVFFYYQFYPEMHGALALALLFRALALGGPWRGVSGWGLGLVLAFLPWLHQKFLPVWGILILTAVFVAWRDRWSRSGWWRSARAASGIRTADAALQLRHHRLRPSRRALPRLGTRGRDHSTVGQGILGLLLDARYGVLPYAPVYALALAGLLLGGPVVRRLSVVFPATLVYYVTVAAADNWAGAVCNLGRYFMPVAPVFVVLVAVAVDRVSSRRGAVALVLALAAWTGLFALALRWIPWRPTIRGCSSAGAPTSTATPTFPICSSANGRREPWSRCAHPRVWRRRWASLAGAGSSGSWEGAGVARERRGRCSSVFLLARASFSSAGPPCGRSRSSPTRFPLDRASCSAIPEPALVREDRAELRPGVSGRSRATSGRGLRGDASRGGEGRVELPGVATSPCESEAPSSACLLAGGERVRGAGGGRPLVPIHRIEVERGLVLRPVPDSGNTEP